MKTFSKISQYIFFVALFVVTTLLLRYVRNQYINYSLTREVIIGNDHAITYYVNMGADVRNTAYHGLTPLRAAVCYNQNSALTIILDHGADPNDVIFKAAELGNKAIIKNLMSHGADIYTKKSGSKFSSYDIMSPDIKNACKHFHQKR